MPDRYLDFAGVSEALAEMGVTEPDGSPYKTERIRTWADRGRLPFFKGPDGKRRIAETKLRATFEKMQAEACGETQAAGRGRRKGR